MKLIALISAGLIGTAAMLAPVTAGAQERRVTTNRHVVVTQRSHVERHGNGYGHDRTRRVCKVKYRNHRRIRTCRTVRTRY